MDEQVVIAHADGREFQVTRDAYFHTPVDAEGHTYQQLGFRIVRWAGGPAYAPPSERDAEHQPPEPPDVLERQVAPEPPAEATDAPRAGGPEVLRSPRRAPRGHR